MASAVTSFKDLMVWQKAMDLAVLCYARTEHFPSCEQFGLRAQIRRSAVSVPANIAEGHGRDHLREYVNHLSMANGSLMELETHLHLALRLGFVASDAFEEMLQASAEVGRLLAGLSRSLRRKLQAAVAAGRP